MTMADPIRNPHSDPAHPLREASAHLHGELTPEEEAAFQAHLPTCDQCQNALRVGEALLPLASKLLAEEPPLRSGAEYMKMLAEARAKNAAEDEAKAQKLRSFPAKRGWKPYLPWLVGGMAIAAALLVLLRPGVSFELQQLPGKAHVIELAPPGPDSHPPPEAPDLPFEATLEGTTLHVRIPRESDDHYVAAALLDSKRGLWLLRRGDERDRCLFGCGPIDASVEVTSLPPGPIEVYVMVSPTPLVEVPFEEWIRAMGKHAPLTKPRAAGIRKVER
jgi:hypothetical protein